VLKIIKLFSGFNSICPVSHFVTAKQYYGPVRHIGAETHLTNNSGDKCETA
jgi:hypothetical protein